MTVLDQIASSDVDARAAELLAGVGRGFASVEMVSAAAALFERWAIPDRLLTVAPPEYLVAGELSHSARMAERLGFKVRRRDREMVEGPRARVVVSPGSFAVRRTDPVKRDRAVARALEGARKRAQMVEQLRQGGACVLEEEHPVWHPDCACGVPWCEPVGVSRLHSWSPRSRARMTERLKELDYAPLFADRGRPAMVTLTYPGDWRAVAPAASIAHRHVRLLQKRWARRWGSRLVGVWKREFQDRGAPHYHILTTPPADPGLRDWLSTTWAEIVGADWCGDWCWQRPFIGPRPRKGGPRTGACCEYGRHVVGGTGVDYHEGARALDPVRLAVYFTKHGSFTAKEYQNAAPREWVHDATCVDADCSGCSGEGVGRFWGTWGLDRAIAAVEVADDVAEAARRIARRHSRSGRYYVAAPVWRKRYSEKLDTSTGELVTSWRWTKRTSLRAVYHLRGSAGFVSANDGPAFAAQVARGVARQVFLSQVTAVFALPSGRTRVATSGGRPIGFLP
ncbi:hypothetical protein SAMN04487968_1161 [Nocardioides terrae]|uniref:Replication-associated protein ORF2/G2P domain-containing protein n=1 Tax=Nocardioides terrae TaxID=574651 RepID=A0A1I1NB06_9ACTN|nr:hypothetical protein [Nocardioides terrae]SFC94861.1 hypothetical protein SAMN04487968_1161 [Nocardioides terrae]